MNTALADVKGATNCCVYMACCGYSCAKNLLLVLTAVAELLPDEAQAVLQCCLFHALKLCRTLHRVWLLADAAVADIALLFLNDCHHAGFCSCSAAPQAVQIKTAVACLMLSADHVQKKSLPKDMAHNNDT